MRARGYSLCVRRGKIEYICLEFVIAAEALVGYFVRPSLFVDDMRAMTAILWHGARSC